MNKLRFSASIHLFCRWPTRTRVFEINQTSDFRQRRAGSTSASTGQGYSRPSRSGYDLHLYHHFPNYCSLQHGNRVQVCRRPGEPTGFRNWIQVLPTLCFSPYRWTKGSLTDNELSFSDSAPPSRVYAQRSRSVDTTEASRQFVVHHAAASVPES